MPWKYPEDNKLTHKQLITIVSRFQTSCHKLKSSGDYPEEKADREILNILIDMKYTVMKEEGRRANAEPNT